MPSPLPTELWCEDLEWWFQARDALCGHKSVLGAQISALERGGAPGTPDADPYTDAQLGWGSSAYGVFARDREIYRAWTRLDRSTQIVLAAYYSPRIQLRQKRATEMDITDPPGLGSVAALLVPRVLGKKLEILKLKLAAEKLVRAAHKAYYVIRGEDARAWAVGSE